VAGDEEREWEVGGRPTITRDLTRREVVCAPLPNHPVRTRMPGGVGRAG
jgi:hypothetical protein